MFLWMKPSYDNLLSVYAAAGNHHKSKATIIYYLVKETEIWFHMFLSFYDFSSTRG